MAGFFVAGLINVETTIAIDGFPLPYFPVRYPFFGLNTTVSGVGCNVALALHTLGNTVNLASLIGTDPNGLLAQAGLQEGGLKPDLVLPILDETAQSAILYDPQGRRQIHVDLKDIQDTPYPQAKARQAIAACDLAVCCNINFARPLLALARKAGRTIATDVHALADPDDAYNQDFMRAADILFLSHESLPCAPEDFVHMLWDRYANEIIVIGLGAGGALLAVRRDDFTGRFPAVTVRPVVNTIGAGDALFSAFIHTYTKDPNPYRAIQSAILFASYKIGEKGAAQGFLSGTALEALSKQNLGKD